MGTASRNPSLPEKPLNYFYLKAISSGHHLLELIEEREPGIPFLQAGAHSSITMGTFQSSSI
jgi:hypothetical protein